MSRLMVLLTFLAMSPPGLVAPDLAAIPPSARDIIEAGDRCPELRRDAPPDVLRGDAEREVGAD